MYVASGILNFIFYNPCFLTEEGKMKYSKLPWFVPARLFCFLYIFFASFMYNFDATFYPHPSLCYKTCFACVNNNRMFYII